MTPILIRNHRFLPNVYAIDPATVTGLAWIESHPLAGSPICSVTLRIDNTEWGARAFSLFKTIEAWAADADTVIAYECAIRSHDPTTTHFIHEHGMLRGAIECAARQRGLRTLFFNVTEVKAFATGSGRATKAQMMRACQTMLGITPTNDNECDAIWVLALASHALLGGVIHDLKPRKSKRFKPRKSEARLFR